jgi:16S rRNA (cytosine967-C5)-methyltransferase
MDKIQQAAVSVVSQVLGGRNLNQVLSEVIKTLPEKTPQQRGALQDLSYGTLRYYGQLNSVIDMLLNKPLQDVQIRYLLLIAIYQLQYSKAAHHAVVDFAVTAVRKLNPAASGLVNAILRNFLRNKNSLLMDANKTEVGRYSYPQWWINEIKTQYGKQATEILLAGNLHPPMTLRVNRKQISADNYLTLLSKSNISATKIGADAILLEQPVMVDKLPGFIDGMVSVQDAGAQYAAGLLDVKDGMRVLDACSAPGGKTAHILETANVELIALDKDAKRLERVRENIHRLKLDANLLLGDASKPSDWWDGKQFQRILADVPCSATGVVRRHPDIKWLRRAEDIEQYAQQQEQILSALWPMLEPAGKLLYVTCSIFQRENQKVITTFLNEHADAVQLPITGIEVRQGQLLPNDQRDGFFYALLHKKN